MSETRQRTHQIGVRLNDEELAIAEREAERLGITAPEFLRGRIDPIEAIAWEQGYRDAMNASIGRQLGGNPNVGAVFPADYQSANPYLLGSEAES